MKQTNKPVASSSPIRSNNTENAQFTEIEEWLNLVGEGFCRFAPAFQRLGVTSMNFIRFELSTTNRSTLLQSLTPSPYDATPDECNMLRTALEAERRTYNAAAWDAENKVDSLNDVQPKLPQQPITLELLGSGIKRLQARMLSQSHEMILNASSVEELAAIGKKIESIGSNGIMPEASLKKLRVLYVHRKTDLVEVNKQAKKVDKENKKKLPWFIFGKEKQQQHQQQLDSLTTPNTTNNNNTTTKNNDNNNTTTTTTNTNNNSSNIDYNDDNDNEEDSFPPPSPLGDRRYAFDVFDVTHSLSSEATCYASLSTTHPSTIAIFATVLPRYIPFIGAEDSFYLAHMGAVNTETDDTNTNNNTAYNRNNNNSNNYKNNNKNKNNNANNNADNNNNNNNTITTNTNNNNNDDDNIDINIDIDIDAPSTPTLDTSNTFAQHYDDDVLRTPPSQHSASFVERNDTTTNNNNNNNTNTNTTNDNNNNNSNNNIVKDDDDDDDDDNGNEDDDDEEEDGNFDDDDEDSDSDFEEETDVFDEVAPPSFGSSKSRRKPPPQSTWLSNLFSKRDVPWYEAPLVPRKSEVRVTFRDNVDFCEAESDDDYESQHSDSESVGLELGFLFNPFFTNPEETTLSPPTSVGSTDHLVGSIPSTPTQGSTRSMTDDDDDDGSIVNGVDGVGVGVAVDAWRRAAMTSSMAMRRSTSESSFGTIDSDHGIINNNNNNNNNNSNNNSNNTNNTTINDNTDNANATATHNLSTAVPGTPPRPKDKTNPCGFVCPLCNSASSRWDFETRTAALCSACDLSRPAAKSCLSGVTRSPSHPTTTIPTTTTTPTATTTTTTTTTTAATTSSTSTSPSGSTSSPLASSSSSSSATSNSKMIPKSSSTPSSSPSSSPASSPSSPSSSPTTTTTSSKSKSKSKSTSSTFSSVPLTSTSTSMSPPQSPTRKPPNDTSSSSSPSSSFASSSSSSSSSAYHHTPRTRGQSSKSTRGSTTTETTNERRGNTNLDETPSNFDSDGDGHPDDIASLVLKGAMTQQAILADGGTSRSLFAT